MSRTITSAFGFVIIAQIFTMALGAIVTPLLTRILGPSTYGQYGVVLAFFSLLQILVTSGITSGSKKFLAEDRPQVDWKDHVWGYYGRLATLLALLFALSLIVAAEFGIVEFILGEEYIVYFYFLAILTFVVQYKDYINRSLMGLQLERYSEPLKVIRKIAFGISAVTLAYLGYGVAGVLTGKIIAGLIIIVLGLIIIRQQLRLSAIFESAPPEFPTEEFRSFNNASIAYVFLLTSLYHVDVLMLQGSVSSAEVGFYKAALVLVELLWLAPKALQDVMIQSVAQDWFEGNIERINEVATRSTHFILLFTMLCAIGLAALAEQFVPVFFGADYSPAVFPLLVLLPGTIFFAVTRPLLTITQAKGEMRPLVIATGIAAGLNLLLNALLIPRYGMTGAAVATTIGYGSLGITQSLCAKYVGYQPVTADSIYRIGATCLLSGPIILVAGAWFSGYISLLIVPPLGGVIFFIAAIVTGAIPKSDVLLVLERILPNDYLSLSRE